MNTNANKKYVVSPGEVKHPEAKVIPLSAQRDVVCLDSSAIPGSIFTKVGWYISDLEVPGLRAHKSDEVLMFLGSDFDHPEMLNANLELQIENDILTLDKTCAVYIPGGAAHGNIKIKNMEKPIMYCCCHPFASAFEEIPAEATAPKGLYSKNYVDEYDTTGVQLPNVGEGVITRLYYLDSSRVPGAPYFESVWFNNTPAFLPAHVHPFDEVIFFAGSDPEHPEELGGTIIFYVDDEPIEITKSSLIFCPAGLTHNPFEIKDLKRPVLHFTGGNSVKYN